MEDSVETSRKPIDWEVTLHENQSSKPIAILQQSLMTQLAGWEYIKSISSEDLSDLEEGASSLMAIMTVVISDCILAAGIDKMPTLVPQDGMKDNNLAYVYKDEDGNWFMGINQKMYVSAIRELNNGTYVNNPDSSLARFIYGVAHETANIRQVDLLGMSMPYSELEVPPQVVDVVGEEAAAVTGYVTDSKEAHSAAFATRYLRVK